MLKKIKDAMSKKEKKTSKNEKPTSTKNLGT